MLGIAGKSGDIFFRFVMNGIHIGTNGAVFVPDYLQNYACTKWKRE